MGGRRITLLDYNALATRRGFVYIGPMPRTTNDTSLWECGIGHKWIASYTNMRSGWGCPHCSGRARKFRDDYIALANNSSITWIGIKAPPNTKINTKWKCNKGHVWKDCYNHILLGARCPQCSGLHIKTEDDYIKLAEQRNFTIDGKCPKSPSKKTYWKCARGHKFRKSYSEITMGYGCRKCYTKTKKDYIDTGAIVGIIFVGPIPPNTKTRTRWKCARGHIFSISYNRVLDVINRRPPSCGCQECNRIMRSGENCYFWAGGVDIKVKEHYYNGFNKTVKRLVRQRDKNLCSISGCKHKHLHVHHIVPAIAAHPRWANELSNLILLCRKHHGWADWHLKESIPKLRGYLSGKYGYSYNGARLTRAMVECHSR